MDPNAMLGDDDGDVTRVLEGPFAHGDDDGGFESAVNSLLLAKDGPSPGSPPVPVGSVNDHEHDLRQFEQQVDAENLLTPSSQSPAPLESTHSGLDAILAMTPDGTNPAHLPHYEPLRGQWYYGQAVLARYRKTPYFFSGNIATYLGAGLFMIVFDDGSLNYRVKREDIVIRPVETARDENASDQRNEDEMTEMLTERITWYRTDVVLSENPVMVDFSVSPPRQLPATRVGYEVGEDAVMDMKHLECGVAYEDDSTQVSDSDDSSEEDMTMTPWQQMTQTFGMGPRHIRHRASRRSSVSSLSQIERLSMSGKSMNQILPSPKSIKQIVQDYLAKKTKKVQPSTVSSDPVSEAIRKMEAKREDLRAKQIRGRTESGASVPILTPGGTRVVFEREQDGLRAYGTIKSRLPNGDFEIVAENDQTITVQVLPMKDLDFLPSIKELQAQISDLQQTNKRLYAGRKVQVNLYPGTRFSGPGVITLEDDTKIGMFHVLLQNRIRLVNVPADKIVPLKERKKGAARITEDQYLVCTGKVKVYIGDQVLVKCEGEYEGQIEEKLGILNGVYSNKTAAVDFADGSTGYEIPPQAITKIKRHPAGEDMDLMSLKNAVLMQAASTADNYNIDVGYQVKADHPRRASVESCVVIRKHSSTACDLRFQDGTISFNVFPSQMILDKSAVGEGVDRPLHVYEASVGDYVLAWSSRFGRYCSAKVAAKSTEGPSALYTIVFDYGEQKQQVPADKISSINDPDALSPMQKLTNYSIDTIGFEVNPITFVVGEVVMARVHGSVQYFNGWVEAVHEKERTCAVVFDSSERDEDVKFSAMFSVDSRHRFQSIGHTSGSASSNGGTGNISPGPMIMDRDSTAGEDSPRRRRHSASSVGSMIMSVAGSFFRAKKDAERIERRGSHLITEVGAHIKPRAPDE